jgi:hypothetical protein
MLISFKGIDIYKQGHDKIKFPKNILKERKYPKPQERQSTYKVEKGGTPFSLRIYEKMVWISYMTLN